MTKKITLVWAALIMAAFCVNAQTLNNPVDENGYFIVKWDCENETWAASNDFEIDEAFTFAVDVTGTALEEWLKETPANEDGTRSLAVNRWTGFGDFNGDCNRLKLIKGNIYGTTWCFSQLANTFDLELATVPGTVTYFAMQVFGFEYTPADAGALWWQWPAGWLPEGSIIDAVEENAFTSAPYTGTKKSVEFYADDYEGFWSYTAGGYAPYCTSIATTGIPPVATGSPVVGYEYYNLQGMKLSKQPENGLFIEKARKANGTFTATKVMKTVE